MRPRVDDGGQVPVAQHHDKETRGVDVPNPGHVGNRDPASSLSTGWLAQPFSRAGIDTKKECKECEVASLN